MKQFFFVKQMAVALYITVSQRGEPIEVMVPGVNGYSVLAEWSIDVAVGETPLLYKRIMMPSVVSESDVMAMVDAVIGIEFTEGMIAVKKFEIAEEGDF